MIPTSSPIQHPNVYQTPACPGIPGDYFESCVLIPRKLDANTVHAKHGRRYSVQCSDKIRFSQLRIKYGVAKSCPCTHTALQAPMPDTPTISSQDCNTVIYSCSLTAIGAVQHHSMSNSCECMGVNRKPCNCMQFIKSHTFYCKSRENLYQYYKSLENPYQVLQVTHAVSERAMKLKVHMINHYHHST